MQVFSAYSPSLSGTKFICPFLQSDPISDTSFERPSMELIGRLLRSIHTSKSCDLIVLAISMARLPVVSSTFYVVSSLSFQIAFPLISSNYLRCNLRPKHPFLFFSALRYFGDFDIFPDIQEHLWNSLSLDLSLLFLIKLFGESDWRDHLHIRELTISCCWAGFP